MKRYEILLLTIPELTKDEESSLENQIEKFINEHKGSIISFDRWGKYRLSYPVRRNDYGVYFLMRFEIENSKDFLKELRNLFYVRFNDIVMRHIVTALKKDQSLEYAKPPSLEDAPKKQIGFFDKKDMRPRGLYKSDNQTDKPVEIVKEELKIVETQPGEKKVGSEVEISKVIEKVVPAEDKKIIEEETIVLKEVQEPKKEKQDGTDKKAVVDKQDDGEKQEQKEEA